MSDIGPVLYTVAVEHGFYTVNVKLEGAANPGEVVKVCVPPIVTLVILIV